MSTEQRVLEFLVEKLGGHSITVVGKGIGYSTPDNDTFAICDLLAAAAAEPLSETNTSPTQEEIELAILFPYEGDLEGMSDEDIEQELRLVQNTLDEEEPWRDALSILQQRRAREKAA